MPLSDTNLGIILGGSIALVPTVLSYVFQHCNAKAQRRHELQLRKIDILEPRRLDALQQYMDVLGICLDRHRTSGAIFASNEVSEFMKVHERASLFVSEETAAAMIDALPDILAVDDADAAAQRIVNRHQLPKIARLLSLMRGEMRCSYEAFTPQSTRKE